MPVQSHAGSLSHVSSTRPNDRWTEALNQSCVTKPCRTHSSPRRRGHCLSLQPSGALRDLIRLSMRILLIHNRYRQSGGEDEVFRAEAALLRGAGHSVVEYTRTNDDIVVDGIVARARVASNTVWARGEANELRQTIERLAPDVAHFHNTLPLISPAAYYACHDAGIPVVQTLHNYRLRCPAATNFRNGRVCDECSEHGLLRSVRYGCYRGSRSATAAVATMLAVHRALGTWRDQVDTYIALSEFARRIFVDATLPAEKVW